MAAGVAAGVIPDWLAETTYTSLKTAGLLPAITNALAPRVRGGGVVAALAWNCCLHNQGHPGSPPLHQPTTAASLERLNQWMFVHHPSASGGGAGLGREHESRQQRQRHQRRQ